MSSSPPQHEDAGGDATSRWTAHLDNEGRTYYYNAETEESAWEPPEGEEIAPPSSRPEEDEPTTADAGTPRSRDDDGPPPGDDAASTSGDDDEESAATAPSDGGWVVYEDDGGAEYYYNAATGETQWEKPEGAVVSRPPPDEEEEGTTSGDVGGGEETTENDAAAPSSDDKDATTAAAAEASTDEKKDETKDKEASEKEGHDEGTLEDEEDSSSSERRVAAATASLEASDAIMEPDYERHVLTLRETLGETRGAKEAYSKIVNSYRGNSAVCGLLAYWIVRLTDAAAGSGDDENNNNGQKKEEGDGGSSNHKAVHDPHAIPKKGVASNSSTVASTGASGSAATAASDKERRSKTAESLRALSTEVVRDLALNRYTRAGGDALLSEINDASDKKKGRLLKDMVDAMVDATPWRRLLIDLSARHSGNDDPLLNGCLLTASHRGHNREIVRRVGRSDDLVVFHAALESDLTALGVVGVGGAGDAEACAEDLARSCASMSFDRLHARQFTEDLVRRARRAAARCAADGPRRIGLERAARKWERLKERLEEDATDGGGVTNEAHVAKRRRVEVGLATSDLYQRQRRRPRPDRSDEPPKEQPLDTAAVELVRRHAMSTPLDDALADRLLAPHHLIGQTRSVGELMIGHPSTVRALLSHLFKPGAGRVATPRLRHKCSKLLAKAVLAARESFGDAVDRHDAAAAPDTPLTTDEQESALWKMILRASELCNEIENMVSFTVLDYRSTEDVPPEAPPNASAGGRLCYVVVRSPLVAQGVALWIQGLADSAAFPSSAAYPSLAPCLLSLARIVAVHHPFCRRRVLDAATAFLQHKSPEGSYGKSRALRQQLVRLLLWLAALGGGRTTLRVFGTVAARVSDEGGRRGATTMDASLLRYLLSGVLDVVRPPLSVPLVRVLARLLTARACTDAVVSPHFSDDKKRALRGLVGHLEATLRTAEERGTDDVTEDDAAAVRALALTCGRLVS